jgi:CheY-like chemotaxis protein
MARILIVDDDDAFRKALSESIRDLGHQVIEAKHADEARDQIDNADVTFLDLKMPGMTGIEFLRDANPPTPVIMLTAFAIARIPLKQLNWARLIISLKQWGARI